MPRKRKPSWTPATEFKLIKLPPSGPKPGQSVDAHIYGKDKAYERLVDNPSTTFHDIG
jgi:hypothetical protein